MRAPSATSPNTPSIPAIAHGVSKHIGSVEKGKLADLVLWSPAFFGVKPDMIIKGGTIVAALMGDPNASIPTPQPVHYRPMFGAFGKALTASSRGLRLEGGAEGRPAQQARRRERIGGGGEHPQHLEEEHGAQRRHAEDRGRRRKPTKSAPMASLLTCAPGGCAADGAALFPVLTMQRAFAVKPCRYTGTPPWRWTASCSTPTSAIGAGVVLTGEGGTDLPARSAAPGDAEGRRRAGAGGFRAMVQVIGRPEPLVAITAATPEELGAARLAYRQPAHRYAGHRRRAAHPARSRAGGHAAAARRAARLRSTRRSIRKAAPTMSRRTAMLTTMHHGAAGKRSSLRSSTG